MSKQPVIRPLNEDMEFLGLKLGVDLTLAGVTEAKVDPKGEPEDGPEDDDKVSDADEAVIEHAFKAVKRVIKESEIDYDKSKFEKDLREGIHNLARKLRAADKNLSEDGLRDALLDKLVESTQKTFDERLDKALGKPLDKLTEAELAEKVASGNRRVIMSRKGGRLVRKVQKLTARKDRIRRNRKARKHKGHLKVKRAKWMRTGKAKKGMRLRKNAEARTPSNPKLGESQELTPIQKIRALLQEDAVEASATLSESAQVRASMEEAFDRVIRIGDLLATFFEDHGVESDFALAESLTEMIEVVGPTRDALTESTDAATTESRLKKLQTFMSILGEALAEFDRYKLTEAKPSDDEDEEDDEEDEEDDEEWCDGDEEEDGEGE